MPDKVVWEPKKRVTLSEIAKVAGVATSTVSSVLNNKTRQITIPERTRERVLAVAKRLGYKPNAAARMLATGRSYSILVAALEPPYWDYQLAGLLRGVETCLFTRGYSLNICTVGPNEGVKSFNDILGSGWVDGVLLAGSGNPMTHSTLAKLAASSADANLPVVGMANVFSESYAITPVDIDDQNGAELAVAHLTKHGHRRIALLGLSNEIWAANREIGYRRALELAHLDVDPELVVLLDAYSNRPAYDAAMHLAQSKDLSAMFVMTDHLAVAAMLGLKRAGRRVPEDVAVIGFDDNDEMVEFVDPPLTTVYNPLFESGRAVAEALIGIIEGNPVERVKLPVTLTIRESCGCKCDGVSQTRQR